MKKLHVLFVDDHADTRFVFSRLLGLLGYQVSLAATAVEAEESADHVHPDLAIVDLGLPSIDEGLALLKSLARRHIRCAVCSGYAQSEDVHAATDCGCLAFIIKPTTIELLVEGIDKAMSAPLALPLLPTSTSTPKGAFRTAA